METERECEPVVTAGTEMGAFLAHTKCPPSFIQGINYQPLAGEEGFFQFAGLSLYGRLRHGAVSRQYDDSLFTNAVTVSFENHSVTLPFNPTRIIENLRQERYVRAVNSEISYISDSRSFSRQAYYAIRPLLPVPIRRILQRAALRDWARIPFPKWPLDTTVEDFIDQLWRLVLKISGEEQLPFIWYWPKGYESCGIMTHDVETAAGQNFCRRLLEIEREYGIKSSFELVPEVRYKLSGDILDAIRAAGSEVCIHGLNHDGKLFESEPEFRRRAGKINQYARQLGATGFRSPVMYRNQEWYDAFDFSYDMSVPNVGHLDPQRGGCCTVFPYFIGNIVELPLTTIQDYPLYNVLRSDPLDMWSRQIKCLHEKHGLASFIIHPDYTIERDRQEIYGQLLKQLAQYRDERRMWLTLPGEVDRWWRQRNAMTLDCEAGRWIIRGEAADRAEVAYARLENNTIRYVRN